jgi:hypothetical protein
LIAGSILRAVVASALSCLAAVLLAFAGDEDPNAYRQAKVTYVTSASVYIDAGSDDGLATGQTLEIVRDGAVVLSLRVNFLASHRAVCDKVSGDAIPAVDDGVRYIPQAPVSPPKPPAAQGSFSASGGATKATPGSSGLHGRIGVRYLYVKNTSGSGQDFSQPALDLRLDGTQMGGAPFDLSVDVRARRTLAANSLGTTTTQDLTNVYRLAVSWRDPESPWRVTAGRQYSPSLATISIFDGILGEYRSRRFSVGAFSGTEPDPNNLGYSAQVQDHGAYVEWRSPADAARRWALTMGLIGSYEQAQINREFTYVQASLAGKRLSLWLTEETDLNRGWRKQAEGNSFTLTSALLNLRYRLSDAWTLNAGYDDRRNVRLFRDLITPVTQFDDQYRNGAWAGATCRFLHHFTTGFDVRTSAGGSLGGANGYSVYLGAVNLSSLALDIQSRSTRYTNNTLDGWLHSLSFGIPVGSRFHVALSGGVRDETPALTTSTAATTTRLTWYGLDTDVALGRHLFTALSLEHSQGTFDASDQGYLTVAYRW